MFRILPTAMNAGRENAGLVPFPRATCRFSLTFYQAGSRFLRTRAWELKLIFLTALFSRKPEGSYYRSNSSLW